MSIGGVATHDSILLARELGRVVRLDESFNLLLLHFDVFLLLLNRHDEAAVSDQLALAFGLSYLLFFDGLGLGGWWLALAVTGIGFFDLGIWKPNVGTVG